MPYVMQKMHIALSSSFTQEKQSVPPSSNGITYDLVMDLL